LIELHRSGGPSQAILKHETGAEIIDSARSKGLQGARAARRTLAEAQLYPSDQPRRDETPAPRAIPEFVMGQLESPANLDRIADSRFRLLVEILIRTGLRIGDATRLALDCLIRDPQGAVYLRYRNHKMRRDAVVPIDDELTTMIQAQQACADSSSRPRVCCCRAAAPTPTGGCPSPPRHSITSLESGSKPAVSQTNSGDRCV
jgi:integrase